MSTKILVKPKPLGFTGLKKVPVSKLYELGVSTQVIDMALTPPFCGSIVSCIVLLLDENYLQSNHFNYEVYVSDCFMSIGGSRVSSAQLASSFATLGYLMSMTLPVTMENFADYYIDDVPGQWQDYVPVEFRSNVIEDDELLTFESFVEVVYRFKDDPRDVHICTDNVYPSLIILYKSILDDVAFGESYRFIVHTKKFPRMQLPNDVEIEGHGGVMSGYVLNCLPRHVHHDESFINHYRYTTPVGSMLSEKSKVGVLAPTNHIQRVVPVCKCFCRLCYFLERSIAVLMLSDYTAQLVRSYFLQYSGHPLMGNSGDSYSIVLAEYARFFSAARDDSVKLVVSERVLENYGPSLHVDSKKPVVRFMANEVCLPTLQIIEDDYRLEFDDCGVVAAKEFLKTHELPKIVIGDIKKMGRVIAKEYIPLKDGGFMRSNRDIDKVAPLRNPAIKRLAGALIVRKTRKGEEFLLLRGLGVQSIPKGRIKPGEDPYNCMLRETREEAGIDLTRHKYQYHFEIDYLENGNKVVFDIFQYNVKAIKSVVLQPPYNSFTWQERSYLKKMGHYSLIERKMSDFDSLSPDVIIMSALRNVCREYGTDIQLGMKHHGVRLGKEVYNIDVHQEKDGLILNFAGKNNFIIKTPNSSLGNINVAIGWLRGAIQNAVVGVVK